MITAGPLSTTDLAAAMSASIRGDVVTADEPSFLAATFGVTGVAPELVVVAADAATWQPAELFDAVLLDAPCTATGTIRRHPDILRLRRESDIDSLAETQRLMLAGAQVGTIDHANGLCVLTAAGFPSGGTLSVTYAPAMA